MSGSLISDRIAEVVGGVGAVLMIAALLLPWWSGSYAPSGFELAVRVDVVIVAIAVLVLAAAVGALAGRSSWAFSVVACIGGAFITGLLLVDPIELGTFKLGGSLGSDQDPNRGVGYYAELVSALLVALSGGVASWRNAAGSTTTSR